MPPEAPRRLILRARLEARNPQRQHHLARTGRTENRHRHERLLRGKSLRRIVRAPGNHLARLGDTDRTPDGGPSAGFLYGMANVRK